MSLVGGEATDEKDVAVETRELSELEQMKILLHQKNEELFNAYTEKLSDYKARKMVGAVMVSMFGKIGGQRNYERVTMEFGLKGNYYRNPHDLNRAFLKSMEDGVDQSFIKVLKVFVNSLVNFVEDSKED